MASAPTNASFVARYPEFNGAGSSLLTEVLAEAARQTNGDVYQTDALATDAVMVKAAQILLLHPYGRKLRVEAPDQVFALEYRLKKLQRSATMGLRVF